MIEVRITRRGADPVLTIKVTGLHDFFRLADHLTRGQVEFAAIGFRMQRYMRRRYKREGWRTLNRHYFSKEV